MLERERLGFDFPWGLRLVLAAAIARIYQADEWIGMAMTVLFLGVLTASWLSHRIGTGRALRLLPLLCLAWPAGIAVLAVVAELVGLSGPSGR